MLLHKYFYIYTNAPTKCLQKHDLTASQKEEITQVFVNKSMGGKMWPIHTMKGYSAIKKKKY